MFLSMLFACWIAQGPGLQGQETGMPVILTVCEALCNPKPYEGKSVYIVGRLVSTPEGNWLSQDKCPCSVTVDGKDRKTMVSLDYESSFSQQAEYPLVRALAIEKLKDVRRTTKFDDDDEAGVAFGEFRSVVGQISRTESAEKYPPRGRTGFGHMGGAPAALLGTGNVLGEAATPQ